MLDSLMIPVARLFRLIRLDASNVMRRAFHQLTDQATGLTSNFAACGGWSGLESLRFTGVPWIKLTHQGTKRRKYHLPLYFQIYIYFF